MFPLSEKIETINKFLVDEYGFDANDGNPIWRVVWAPDQYEKYKSKTTPEGIEMLEPRIMFRPKYRQWIGDKWVLERYVIVPLEQQEEIQCVFSYEPIWVFETQAGVYLPPRSDVAKIVIDGIYAATGKKSMRKYVDPDKADPIESKKARIDGIIKELFGNETPTGDALAHKTGVTVPHPQKVTEH